MNLSNMKKRFLLFLMLITGILIPTSCIKEERCGACGGSNNPPVAIAGPDQVMFFPAINVMLDGSKSYDPDSNIVSYSWTKIAGPYPFRIVKLDAARVLVTNLVEGTYQFELTVTDAGGLFNKDIVRIEVKPKEEPESQQNTGNVIFYCPDPTGTVKYKSQTWYDVYNGLYDLITIKIRNSTGALSGVWCKNGCVPRCPVEKDYNAETGSYADFYLPEGTYSWSAENTITSFQGWPELTPEFASFFSIVHKTGGTIMVNPGNKCLLVPIIFQ